MKKSIVFLWDNFGPIHADRANAVGKSYLGLRDVIGVEISAKSDTYEWESESGSSFKKITLNKNERGSWFSKVSAFFSLIFVLLKNINSDFFFCHYERPSVFLSAVILRLLGRRVFIMNDSKFDDYPRFLIKEFFKYIFYTPYLGGVASGVRSRDYLRFLGVNSNLISINYNSMSVDRIVSYVPNNYLDSDFSLRYFIVIARFVDKKNLFVTIDAFKLYTSTVDSPRKLHMVGAGPLEQNLRQYVIEKGLSDLVVFHGFLQTKDAMQLLAGALSLLLLSTEEQFGNVVIEATALGIPCIVSVQCGARDFLVRSGVNGFVVEPDNSQGTAYFMKLISSDSKLWKRMSKATLLNLVHCDVKQFVKAVNQLID